MDRIDRVVAETLGRAVRFVHAAGPGEGDGDRARRAHAGCVRGRPRRRRRVRERALGGAALVVSRSEDIAGAELCSALKNAYATGLGLWDGFVGQDAHDARAACFTQAIAEMRALVVAAGGKAETVHGPAGVGDLHVTAAAGRNRAFGERVGTGQAAPRGRRRDARGRAS